MHDVSHTFFLPFGEESLVLKPSRPVSSNPVNPRAKVTDHPCLHPKPRRWFLRKMSKRVSLRNLAWGEQAADKRA